MGTNSTIKYEKKKGFALLMTLIVVGAVAAIGISVLDLSLKQVQLSTNAKDSEIAFHTANAGMECARYIRRTASSTMESGGDINPSCFSATASPNTRTQVATGADGTISFYLYRFSWGTAPSLRCSEIQTLVFNATVGQGGLTLNSVDDWIDGYPVESKNCAAGERCTVMSTKGWNRSCGERSSAGTVQREVLLQF